MKNVLFYAHRQLITNNPTTPCFSVDNLIFMPHTFLTVQIKYRIFHTQYNDTVPFRIPLFSSSIASGDKSVSVKWSFVWFENEKCFNMITPQNNNKFCQLICYQYFQIQFRFYDHDAYGIWITTYMITFIFFVEISSKEVTH